jgi:hypothetical protein
MMHEETRQEKKISSCTGAPESFITMLRELQRKMAARI